MKNQFSIASRKNSLAITGVITAFLLSACGGSNDNKSNFTFVTASQDSYVRVDRMGQPAIATALLSQTIIPLNTDGSVLNPGNAANPFNDQVDAFNRGNPINDARDFAGIFTTGPQPNSLANIHFKIRPQLVQLGLVPCSTQTVTPPVNNTQMDISKCVAQAGPSILPDVMTIDLNTPTAWPNGRTFDDPVVDRLLAVALLELSDAQPINSLVGVLDPARDETDIPSPSIFPYTRAPYPNP
jgi:hypothetical protein